MQPASKNNNTFDEIVTIIEQARQKAFRAVNRELIEMYWLNTNYTCSTKPLLRELQQLFNENPNNKN